MSVKYAGHRFRTTRWALVMSAAGEGGEASTALSELCEMYWWPAYAFVRRSGFSAEDAQDLTQAFFTRVLEKSYFRDARPDRGRFRSYLLGCLRHFLANARDSERALKRGGSFAHVPLACESGERFYQLEPADTVTPELVYERGWTMAVLAQAMTRVERKYKGVARSLLFQRLKGLLTGDEVSYPELAEALEMTEGALRIAVHRLRKSYGAALRETIAETVDNPADVDDELRYLLDVVGRPPRR
jgi:RNA polymerase sigma factor (sigma-70 family)